MSFIERAKIQFRDSSLINSAREYLGARDNRTKVVLFALVVFVAVGLFFRRLCCSGASLSNSRVSGAGSLSSPTPSVIPENKSTSLDSTPIPQAVFDTFNLEGATHLRGTNTGIYHMWKAPFQGNPPTSWHVTSDGTATIQGWTFAYGPDDIGPTLNAEGVHLKYGVENPTYRIPEEVLKFGLLNGATYYQHGPNGQYYVICRDQVTGYSVRHCVDQSRRPIKNGQLLSREFGQGYNAPDAQGPLLLAERVYEKYGRPTIPDPAPRSTSTTNSSLNPHQQPLVDIDLSAGPPPLASSKPHPQPRSPEISEANRRSSQPGDQDRVKQMATSSTRVVESTPSSSSTAEPEYDGSIPQAVVDLGRKHGALGYQYGGMPGFVRFTTQDPTCRDSFVVHQVSLHGVILHSESLGKHYYTISCKQIHLNDVSAGVVYAKHLQAPDHDADVGTKVDKVPLPENLTRFVETHNIQFYQVAPSGEHFYLYSLKERKSPCVFYLHKDFDGQYPDNGIFLDTRFVNTPSDLSVPSYPVMKIEEVIQRSTSSPQPKATGSSSKRRKSGSSQTPTLADMYLAIRIPDYTKANSLFPGGARTSSEPKSSPKPEQLETEYLSPGISVENESEVLIIREDTENNLRNPSPQHSENQSGTSLAGIADPSPSTEQFIMPIPEAGKFSQDPVAEPSLPPEGVSPQQTSSSSSSSGPAHLLITKEWVARQKMVVISHEKREAYAIPGEKLPKNYEQAQEMIKQQQTESAAPAGTQSQAWIDLRAKIEKRKPGELLRQMSGHLASQSSDLPSVQLD